MYNIKDILVDIQDLSNEITDLYNNVINGEVKEGNLIKITFLRLRIESLFRRIEGSLENSTNEYNSTILLQQKMLLKEEETLIKNLEESLKQVGDVEELVNATKLKVDLENFERVLRKNENS